MGIYDIPTPEETIAREASLALALKEFERLQAEGKMKPRKVSVTIEFTVAPNFYGLFSRMWDEQKHRMDSGTFEQWYCHRVRGITKPSTSVIDNMSWAWDGLYRDNIKIDMKVEEIK